MIQKIPEFSKYMYLDGYGRAIGCARRVDLRTTGKALKGLLEISKTP
jgi:hypothetical protein